MTSNLFFQSDVQNPYSIYKAMLDENPVYWDETNKTWAIYSYEYCVEILKNTSTQIPVVNPYNEQKLNKYALKILENLTRLSNGIQHEISKEIAMLLFSNMKSVDISEIVSLLIESDLVDTKIEWVNSVCKKLPILVLLKSYGFEENDCDFISKKIESIVKIMLPQKTEEQVRVINENSEKLYLIVEKYLSSLSFYKSLLIKTSNQYHLSKEEIIPIVVSNFIGLCIQSFDAGRGILSNSLLQIILYKTFLNRTEIEKSVIETLRFDPPIHNTRRIATDDFYIGESQIKKGDLILIVLASANRDPQKFEDAMNFNIERINNTENLTFGIGGHMCLAKYFSIHLATEALWFLFQSKKTISLLENQFQYEPLINARLPKEIWISIQ
ncbi:cytochrome P450 [Flavobacterium saccharophilum]|uniref:Cytochrome P450 n=1 Tax=Flavobacterium saccharophilum TaxID=29534 RepID=A0A1M7K205_9FLAO|nr:cytochrome P450 [Flavobacterium saccharophilum]SHM59352.1 Cytochrome P450 [Flavobacterium saccharophilum]